MTVFNELQGESYIPPLAKLDIDDSVIELSIEYMLFYTLLDYFRNIHTDLI
jgi:hypothetical protein